MKERDTYFLVGNAHLDPMWQWKWQEGSAEVKATLRSALDRLEEFPHFRFVCSAASIFQWLEEFVPEMMDEIRLRINEGRFVIVGGWLVQPDCNLPSGEGFARQGLYAQRYFHNTFGVTAKVGFCVDSFGHCATLPQILKQSGMDSYIFMRPAPNEKSMDSDIFQWVGPDGSYVTTYRIAGPYSANFSTMEDLEKRIEHLENVTKTELSSVPLFYGVGNHGGGPTIQNLKLLQEYSENHPEKKLVYSDLQDFFTSVNSNDIPLPSYKGELQHHASGCYAAESRIKNEIRRAETSLVAAESYSVLATTLCGKDSKNKEFQKAWNAVCFCHFHDSMGGCCIKEAHDDTMDMLGMAKYVGAVEENNALQTISWKINTGDSSLGCPIVVFNPHGFDVKQLVQINKSATSVRDFEGNIIESQLVYSSTHECYERSDTLFEASVPALGYRVYYLKEEEKEEQEENTDCEVMAKPWAGNHSSKEVSGPVLENEFYHIQFEAYTGYITSFVNKKTNKELVSGRAAVPTVFDEYYHDTWSHAKNFFSDEMARFSDAEVTIVENGPVRATVKVVNRYNNSVLTQYFSLSAGSSQLDVRAHVDWHEKHKLLKLSWPTTIDNPKAYYEIPFGVMERPCDGEEEPGINWTAVKGDNGGVAILNNNTYSSSVKDSTIYQTVVRSPIYGDHGGPRTSESDYTAQGRFDFSYAVMETGNDWSDVIRAGKVLNKGLTNVIETWHTGSFSGSDYSGINISASNVMLSAIKRSEDGTGVVIRLYETEGRDSNFTVTGDVMPCSLNECIRAWSVQTYYCKDGSQKWEKVLFSEYPVE